MDRLKEETLASTADGSVELYFWFVTFPKMAKIGLATADNEGGR